MYKKIPKPSLHKIDQLQSIIFWGHISKSGGKIIDEKEFDIDKAESIVENEKYSHNADMGYDKAIIYKTPEDTCFLHELNTSIVGSGNITALSIEKAISIIYDWMAKKQISMSAASDALKTIDETVDDP